MTPPDGREGRGGELQGAGAGRAVGRDRRAAARHLAAAEPSPALRRPDAGAGADRRRHATAWRSSRSSRWPMPSASCATSLRRAFRRAVTDEDVKPFLARVKAKLDAKALVRAGDARRPQGRAGVAGVPVPAREARQARRLRPGQPAVVLPVELDARRGAAHAGRAGQAAASRTRSASRSSACSSDPKAAAFTENFVGQWLGLRDIDATAPDPHALPRVRRHAQGVDGQGDAAVLRRGAEERPEPDELRGLRLHDAQRPAGEALRHPGRRRAWSSAR